MNANRMFIAMAITVLLIQGCATAKTPTDKGSLSYLGNGICQQNNGLMWQVEPSDLVVDAMAARTYAENLRLGGYADWRLPSRDEYYSLCFIYELKRQGNCPINIRDYFWFGDDDQKAGQYESFPLCGGTDFRYLKSKSGRVMAVRP